MAKYITVGQGADRPKGKLTECVSILDQLPLIPDRIESWWSPHAWRDDYRKGDGWLFSCGIAIDVDYKEKAEMPTDQHISDLIARDMPGNGYHLTPHGCRVVFEFADKCESLEVFTAAARGAAALVENAISDTGYEVDWPTVCDTARFFFTPNCFAKGAHRSAEVVIKHRKPYSPHALGNYAPPPDPVQIYPRVISAANKSNTTDFDTAARQWCADHPRQWPRGAGECPFCLHKGCFNALPSDTSKWFCWSTGHEKPGIRTERGFIGDSLDLECRERGMSRADILRKDGYLTSVIRIRPPSPPKGDDSSSPPGEKPERMLRNNSIATCETIISGNLRDVLEGRSLRLNRMTSEVELDGATMSDNDITRVRVEIERNFRGSTDKDGNEIGMKQSPSDVFAALVKVAQSNSYHPVQDYLNSLTWDGVERIEAVAEEILGAERTQINQSIIKRWFVSAVARAMRPGCKVDTVLILVGSQGAGKSTFFSTLAGKFFTDTAINIESKDAYIALAGCWIFEWGELEVMRRAKDQTAVKAFLAASQDKYRPPYGKCQIATPRSCVIVGSTNADEFLGDDTGARRYWPIKVGKIEIDLLRSQRDQLWAEAMHLLATDCRWWLTEEETALLSPVHQERALNDPWEDKILDWANGRVLEFSLSEALEKAIEKPVGQWVRADQMRVAAILRGHGYTKSRKYGQGWKWSKR